MIRRSLAAGGLLLLACGADGPASRPAGDSNQDDCLVGAYHFAGWWRALPNKYHVAGQDWRPAYPRRGALLGEFNEPETMRREIDAAADHGVDYFQFLWYDQQPGPHREPHQDRLNAGVEDFMAAPNAARMRFTVEYCNHPPFGITGDALWERTCRLWVSMMRHPSYLRVGGRPVFKIHGAGAFLEQCGRDPARVRARIDVLRRISVESGGGDPLVSGGIVRGHEGMTGMLAPYDFLSTYMEMPQVSAEGGPHPYEQLLDYARESWRLTAEKSGKPYVPFLPAGWDPRPWRDPRPPFVLPDRGQWIEALRTVKRALDEDDRLGIPLANGRRQKSFLIYAWNEYGEGGFIAPTRGEGTMKLEAIREVFGAVAVSPERE